MASLSQLYFSGPAPLGAILSTLGGSNTSNSVGGPNVVNDPCPLYGARRSVIELA